jgi:hypothetical protein
METDSGLRSEQQNGRLSALPARSGCQSKAHAILKSRQQPHWLHPTSERLVNKAADRRPIHV